MKFAYWFIALLLFSSFELRSQNSDTTQWDYNLSLSLGSIGATENYLPHYLVFNRWGIVDENQDVFVSGTGGVQYNWAKNWTVSSAVNFRNNQFANLYAQLKFKDWYFIAGKKQLFYGDEPTDLSSGTLGIGPNSKPMPMLEIRLDEYKNVPFTKGYLKFKGNFGHRWMEKDRHISQAMVHSKSFYGMLDLDKEIGLKISSSIIHFGQYGGTSPNGEKQPQSFEDYIRVVLGQGIPNADGTQGEGNAVGNHLGLTEITLDKRLGDHRLKLNYQKQFEDQGSIQYIHLKEYFVSLEWTLPNKGLLTKARIEVLNSKHQSGSGIPDPTDEYPTREANMGEKFGERDDNYNNWLYNSGWTYNGLAIGNSLFLTYQRTLNYLSPYPDYSVAFSNNRISALHIGFEGFLSNKIGYRVMFTNTNNFGTYAGLYEGRFNWEGVKTNPDFDYVFKDGKTQNYSLIALDFIDPFEKIPLNIHLIMGYDFGQLYNNFGAEVSVSYNFFD